MKKLKELFELFVYDYLFQAIIYIVVTGILIAFYRLLMPIEIKEKIAELIRPFFG